MLPAPGLFSTKKFCPSCFGSELVSSRAMVSTGPPGGVGTMTRIGRFG